MIVGHRWNYDLLLRGYRCTPLLVGGVESYQYCIGCGSFIGMEELHQRGISSQSRELHFVLDAISDMKQHKPIESGTYGEFCLRKRNESI